MNETKVREDKAYKVTLILLVGLAAFSTVMRDLNRLQEMVGSVQEFTSQWRGTDDLVMLDVESISMNDWCPNDISQPVNSSSEPGLSDVVAPAQGIEIERIESESITEPEVGGKVELVASNKANCNVPQLAPAKYAPSRNLKQEIAAQRRESQWPAHFEYKTFDRVVTLDLPVTIMADFKADAIDAESPDSPLILPGKINRRLSHGKTDNGRREFMLKKFERTNYSSRRSS